VNLGVFVVWGGLHGINRSTFATVL